MATPRLSTCLQHICSTEPAHGALVLGSRSAGGGGEPPHRVCSHLRRRSLCPRVSHTCTLPSCGSSRTAPLRNRGFCTVVLRRAVMVQVRFRTPPCTRTFAIASAAVCIAARIRMASLSGYSNVRRPLGRRAWFRPDKSSEQHVLTFQAFLLRPPQWTRDWASAQRLHIPTSSVNQEALQRDRQSWILKEPCLRPALVRRHQVHRFSGRAALLAGAGLGSPGGCGRRATVARR